MQICCHLDHLWSYSHRDRRERIPCHERQTTSFELQTYLLMGESSKSPDWREESRRRIEEDPTGVLDEGGVENKVRLVGRKSG